MNTQQENPPLENIPKDFEWSKMKDGIYLKMQESNTVYTKHNSSNYLIDKRILVVISIVTITVVSLLYFRLIPNLVQQKLINDTRVLMRHDSNLNPTINTSEIQNLKFKVSAKLSDDLRANNIGFKYFPNSGEDLFLDSYRRIVPPINEFDLNSRQLYAKNFNLWFRSIVLSASLKYEKSKDQKKSISSNRSFPEVKISLDAGVLYWNNYSSIPDENKFETTLPSFQIMSSYQRYVKSNWFFLAGLQYQILESKCEFQKYIPEYQILNHQRVVKVMHNTYSEEYTNILEQRIDTVDAIHEFRNYNSTKILKLNLGAGRTWFYKQLELTAFGGLAYNVWTENVGRSLLNDQLIDYGGSLTIKHNNLHKMDVFSGLRLSIPIGSKIQIQSSFNLNKSLMNVSNMHGYGAFPLTCGTSVGFVYDLNK